MKSCWYYIEKFIYCGIGGSLWFFLAGRGRRVDPADMQLDAFKFNQGSKSQQISQGPSWLVWAIIAAIVVCFVIALHFKKKQDEKRMKKAASEKAGLRFDMIASRMGVTPVDRKLLMDMSGETESENLLPLVESNENFENCVSQFKQRRHDSKVLSQIYGLRHQLGYSFANHNIPFICTQMLTGDLKMQCQIPHAKKQILFITPVLDVTETRMLIKPPTVKGKSANLKLFSHLICRIRRGKEAEYEFNLPILNQVSGKLHAVVLGHTKKIKRLFIREAERFDVDLYTPFYLVPEDQLNAQNQGTTKDGRTHQVMDGHILDLSIGGLKMETSNSPKELQMGDVLVFHLEGANIRDDLLARIVGLRHDGTMYTLNLQFLHLRDLTRMKVNKFLFRYRKQNPTQAPVAGPPPTVETKAGSSTTLFHDE